jgi:hypothetical protein
MQSLLTEVPEKHEEFANDGRFNKMNNPDRALMVEDHHSNLDWISIMAMKERLNPGRGSIWALLISFLLWFITGIILFVLL